MSTGPVIRVNGISPEITAQFESDVVTLHQIEGKVIIPITTNPKTGQYNEQATTFMLIGYALAKNGPQRIMHASPLVQ
jgi:uncharacterized protein YggU (UPF0235/DUF167 family)